MQHKAVHLVILKCVQAHIIDTLISLPRKPHLLKKHNKELYDKLFDVCRPRDVLGIFTNAYTTFELQSGINGLKNKFVETFCIRNRNVHIQDNIDLLAPHNSSVLSEQKSKLVISSLLNDITSRIPLHKLLIIVTNKQISISYLTFTVFMNFKQLEDDELFPPLT